MAIFLHYVIPFIILIVTVIFAMTYSYKYQKIMQGWHNVGMRIMERIGAEFNVEYLVTVLNPADDVFYNQFVIQFTRIYNNDRGHIGVDYMIDYGSKIELECAHIRVPYQLFTDKAKYKVERYSRFGKKLETIEK